MVSDNGPVLSGWKAIAAFLKRDQRTAMRWAAERGLPVRRVPGGKRGSVYAVPSEITLWLARGAGQPDTRDGVAPQAPAPVATEPSPLAPEVDNADAACPEASPAPSTARWSATVLAAALVGAAMAAGSIELGLFSIGSAAGGTMTACRGTSTGR